MKKRICIIHFLFQLIFLFSQNNLNDVDSFREACRYGNNETVVSFLEDGLPINSKDEYGYTLLMIAVEEENKEICQFLLAKGADVNAKDNDGYTALMIAVKEENKEICQLLMSKGADVNAKNNADYTVLMFAVDGEDKDICQFLLAKGADVNAKDNNGCTALMVAAGHNGKEIALLLVANGADIESKDRNGNTAQVYACLYGNILNHDDTLYNFFERETKVIINDKEIIQRTGVLGLNNYVLDKRKFQSYNADISFEEGVYSSIPLKIEGISKVDGCYYISCATSDEKNKLSVSSWLMPSFFEGDTVECSIYVYGTSSVTGDVLGLLLDNIYYK